MSAGSLRIGKDGTVWLGAKILPLWKEEPELIAYLAWQHLTGQKGWVEWRGALELPGWRLVVDQGALSRVDRAIKRLAGLGFPLIERNTVDKGKKTKEVRLNPALVQQVTHDFASLEDFRAWLFGDVLSSAPQIVDVWPAQHLLTLAVGKFERGDYTESARLCREVLRHTACGPEQRLLALGRLAWIENYRGTPATAKQALEVLQATYETLGGDDSLTVSAQVKAQVRLQMGRYFLTVQDMGRALKAYERARVWIERGGGAREWASYHAALELIAVDRQQWEEAEAQARLALQFAIQGGWAWVQHIQSGYLGNYVLTRFVKAASQKDKPGQQQPPWQMALPLLDEAMILLIRAYEVTVAEGYAQGPAELELLLAHAGRCKWWTTKLAQPTMRQRQNQKELEDLADERIERWLQRAESILRDSNYQADKPRLQIERAELAYLRGDWAQAQTHLAAAQAIAAQFLSQVIQEKIAKEVQERRDSMARDLNVAPPKPRWH